MTRPRATLTYYGHCAFLWTTQQGIRVLIDPYANRGRNWFLREVPPVEADVVLITHDHFDHNAVERIPSMPTVLRGPGTFRLADLVVRGIRDLHSSLSDRPGMPNTIFVIETAGVRACHIGDNRADIPEEVQQELAEPDILMVTVDDSCHLLTYREVDRLVELLRPKVVMPMHYFIPNFTTRESTLRPPDGWLKHQGRTIRDRDSTVVLSREEVPAEETVWVMTPAVR